MPHQYAFVTLTLHHDGALAVLTYNRPQSGNSLHPKLVADILSAHQWLEAQPLVRIVIVTGAGKFFCTGMDLVGDNSSDNDNDSDNDNREEGMSFATGSPFHTLVRLLILSPKILIAAVNGPAAGFGTSSLALYDLVYSVPDAYFFLPFVKVGMTAEACSSLTFPRLMGYQRAAQLFMFAERFGVEEGVRVGLVSKVLPKEGILERVVEIGRELAGLPEGSLRATKRLMRKWTVEELLEANDEECRMIREERLPSGEPKEAMERFMKERDAKRIGKARL